MLIPSKAFSMELQLRGKDIIFLGLIEYGDDVRFENFMNQPEAAKAKYIWFNSGGGKVDVAANIARRIRAAKLTTVLNGEKHCGSACTQLFVAGIHRHYFNAPSKDLFGDKRIALGFHQASAPPRSEIMYASYREMGANNAIKLASRAPNSTMFFISGKTALSLGIATSLQRPK